MARAVRRDLDRKPGFKARDFDFSAALAQARGEAGGAAVTSTRHLRSTTVVQTSGGEPRLQWRQAEQPALDGNTVDLDRERAAFADKKPPASTITTPVSACATSVSSRCRWTTTT